MAFQFLGAIGGQVAHATYLPDMSGRDFTLGNRHGHPPSGTDGHVRYQGRFNEECCEQVFDQTTALLNTCLTLLSSARGCETKFFR